MSPSNDFTIKWENQGVVLNFKENLTLDILMLANFILIENSQFNSLKCQIWNFRKVKISNLNKQYAYVMAKELINVSNCSNLQYISMFFNNSGQQELLDFFRLYKSAISVTQWQCDLFEIIKETNKNETDNLVINERSLIACF